MATFLFHTVSFLQIVLFRVGFKFYLTIFEINSNILSLAAKNIQVNLIFLAHLFIYLHLHIACWTSTKVMWVYVYLLLKSVYLRSFLAFRNLVNFNWSQGWSNGRCLMVCLCMPFTQWLLMLIHHWQLMAYRFVIYMSAWGFCVVRSTLIGNAKASKSGTGNWHELSRFFVYKPSGSSSALTD